MKKEFYIGQPLIVKDTGEKVTLAYSNGLRSYPCNVLKKGRHDYYDYEDLEPSTEFKFSQIIAGLEQGYFEDGDEFVTTVPNGDKVIKVKERDGKTWLTEYIGEELLIIMPSYFSSTWRLVEKTKEMTLEEIEAELGYKIKLKELCQRERDNMIKKKINYIETTMNGYVIKRVPICDYERGKDYIDDLVFVLDSEEVDYYNDITGDMDLLDEFLSRGTNQIEGYDGAIGEKQHIFLEGWLTLQLVYITNKFIGLEIR